MHAVDADRALAALAGDPGAAVRVAVADGVHGADNLPAAELVPPAPSAAGVSLVTSVLVA